jgi:hypothetical protein
VLFSLDWKSLPKTIALAYYLNVVYETEERFKSCGGENSSLSPVANLAFILGTVGEEVYHLRL